MFIVDSFPIPLCDFKRAPAATSPLKCADAIGTLATYGKCATKGLDTFLGFRGSVITTAYGLPVDFAIATADTQGYLVLRIFQNRDLLKVNNQDGRCGFLTAPEPTRKMTIKGFSSNPVRLGNRTYRLGAFSICEKKYKKYLKLNNPG